MSDMSNMGEGETSQSEMSESEMSDV